MPALAAIATLATAATVAAALTAALAAHRTPQRGGFMSAFQRRLRIVKFCEVCEVFVKFREVSCEVCVKFCEVCVKFVKLM